MCVLGVLAAVASASPTASKVTLTYGLWDKNQAPAMQEIIQAFRKTHPNIDVKLQVTPWVQYWTKLEAATTGGKMPDVTWMNGPNFPTYAAAGVISPIGDQVKAAKINLGNYPAGLISMYTFKDKLYALPKDFDTIGLYYNKKLFQQAGVAVPDATWTWSDLESAAKKLTDASSGVYGVAARLAPQEGYYDTIFQAGGYVISPDKKHSGYDSAAALAGLKFWTDLILVDKASPTQQQMTDTDPVQMFQSGKIAMIYAGSWMQRPFSDALKGDLGVTVLPKGKVRANVIHGLGNVISANTKHPKEAWQFVQFLGSKQAALIQAKAGAVIPAYKGTQGAWLKSNPNLDLQAFIQQLPYARPFPVSEHADKWQAMELKEFADAWTGKQPIDQVAKQVASDMNAILAGR